jgi:hypothetical protein
VTGVSPGQVWRNVHGAYVRIDRVGPYHHDGEVADVWWAAVYNEQGNAIGGQIPFDLDGFPGELWTLSGGAS